MSDEITKILSDETKQLLYRYFEAAQNLYGIIPLHKLFRIYNSQNEPISEEQFLEFVDSIDFENKYYDVIGDDELYENVFSVKPMQRYLVGEYLYAFGDYDLLFEVMEGQRGKTYYIPKKEKFLKYENEYYFEKTLEYIELRAFLRNLPSLTKKTADDIAEEIQTLLVTQYDDIEFCLDSALRLGANLDDEETMKKFIDLCYNVNNHTRMHIHCGHTPAELF